MEEEHPKEPSHNNPAEAAKYIKDVNALLQTFEMSNCGFDRYAQQDAYELFLHGSAQLLSKLDSAYFTKMNIDIILDTIPDKVCATFLACLEEAANRVQQRVSSDSIPIGPKLHPKCACKQIYHLLIKKGNKPLTNYSAIFKMHTTTWQK